MTIDVQSDPHAAESRFCPQLRTLRCQIIGLPRQTEQERKARDTQSLTFSPLLPPASLKDNLGLTREEEAKAAKSSTNIHDQLAQLTNLRRLVLGFELRNFYRLIPYSQGSYPVWNYDDPVQGTLEFSLNSRLGRLSTLKNLEEFRFEGQNHRIGRLEIEWMAVN
ncbi:hypothetical protein K457DRAFT_13107 [Linnemannia elongata AG-77]|uniref:Uncharacterized protein n=1 Tax=Linnemannia elongata AG-77 TaxID=1314771 RepID=A0A197KGS4_9FUNG|nr:hypothetical protein K457DRAFT_13107 [Linnemannia elongata AG-77]